VSGAVAAVWLTADFGFDCALANPFGCMFAGTERARALGWPHQALAFAPLFTLLAIPKPLDRPLYMPEPKVAVVPMPSETPLLIEAKRFMVSALLVEVPVELLLELLPDEPPMHPPAMPLLPVLEEPLPDETLPDEPPVTLLFGVMVMPVEPPDEPVELPLEPPHMPVPVELPPLEPVPVLVAVEDLVELAVFDVLPADEWCPPPLPDRFAALACEAPLWLAECDCAARAPPPPPKPRAAKPPPLDPPPAEPPPCGAAASVAAGNRKQTTSANLFMPVLLLPSAAPPRFCPAVPAHPQRPKAIKSANRMQQICSKLHRNKGIVHNASDCRQPSQPVCDFTTYHLLWESRLPAKNDAKKP
jgi:hypothetical protein